MNLRHPLSAALIGLVLLPLVGCASTTKHEGTGEYVDNSIITAKVKSAILEDPALKVAEINVETYKGVVQLSGFVHTQDEMRKASVIASSVQGVKSVKNDMRLK